MTSSYIIIHRNYNNIVDTDLYIIIFNSILPAPLLLPRNRYNIISKQGSVRRSRFVIRVTIILKFDRFHAAPVHRCKSNFSSEKIDHKISLYYSNCSLVYPLLKIRLQYVILVLIVLTIELQCINGIAREKKRLQNRHWIMTRSLGGSVQFFPSTAGCYHCACHFYHVFNLKSFMVRRHTSTTRPRDT